MDRTADPISLSLVHSQFDPGTFPRVTAVVIPSGRTVVARGDYHIILNNHGSVFSFNTGAPVGKCLSHIQICVCL